MAHWVYILYSKQLDRYYVGETENVDVRVDQHNAHLFRGAFTKQATDWALCTTSECRDRVHARAVEAYIKARKRRAYIEHVIADADLRIRLAKKF